MRAATLGILNIIWRWNDVLWPQLVTPDRSLYTVTQKLALAGRSSGIKVRVALATAVMAILPVPTCSCGATSSVRWLRAG